MKRCLTCLLLLLLLLLAACEKNAPCTTHADADKDLFCDVCQQTVLILVDFYGINDLHGKFADTDSNPGVDELTTFLRTMQANDDHAILLSSGDMGQGSSESNLTGGKIITHWMNELDFVAMTLGNHEFDWGESCVEENAAVAEFPMLAINIYDRETDALVSYCQPSVVVDLGAIQVGIIGAIGDCYSSIAPDQVEDIYFKTGRELTALVKAESQRLRENGVDLVIYSLHDGFDSPSGSYITNNQLTSYYDISLSDGYVDLVFEGHTHQRYQLQDEYGVYHIQGGGDNSGITHVELAYNTVTEDFFITDSSLIQSSVYDDLPDDPLIKELLSYYEEEISLGREVLGYNACYRSSEDLCHIVAELYLDAGIEKWAMDYDIVLAGGFFNVRSPYKLAAGDVTYGDLQMLFPFDNELVLCSIRGSDLLRRFINTDNDRYYICRSDYRQIDPDAIYYIVVDSYTSVYGPNRLTEVARYGADIYARDLLAEYVVAGKME